MAAGTGYGYGGGSQGSMFTTGNTGGGSGAMVGVLWYTGDNFPPAYKDKVFAGQVRGWGGVLKVFTPGNRTPQSFGPFNLPSGSASEYNPIDIKMDFGGAIYVSTRFQTENVRWTKGRVIKVWFGNTEPPFMPVGLEGALREKAGRKMNWAGRPGGGLFVKVLRDGFQTIALQTLDGKILAEKSVRKKGGVELPTPARGLHLLVWKSAGERAAAKVLLP
jgi:hypothetical protein